MDIKVSGSAAISRPTRCVIRAGVHATVDLAGTQTALFILERESLLQLVNVVRNHGTIEQVVGIELCGTGARAEVLAGFHGKGRARHSFDITMHHRAPKTKGGILIHGVFEGRSAGAFTGMIKIDPGAQQAQSHFTDNVLLLDGATATSVPKLEILADDVRASHASTTSGIDERQLFYLMSRGIADAEARSMIVESFLHPVI